MKLCTFIKCIFSQCLHQIWQGNHHHFIYDYYFSWRRIGVSLPHFMQELRKMHLMKSAKFHPIEKHTSARSIYLPNFDVTQEYHTCAVVLWNGLFPIDFVQGLILASYQVPKINQIYENVSFNKVFLSLNVYCLASWLLFYFTANIILYRICCCWPFTIFYLEQGHENVSIFLIFLFLSRNTEIPTLSDFILRAV